MINDRIKGLIYGLALGDSWGYPIEFNRNPCTTKPPTPLIITDDTQLSLHNIKTLTEILPFIHQELESPLALYNTELHSYIRIKFLEQYTKFLFSPYNNRAPGVSCVKSITKHHHNIIKNKKNLTGLEGAKNNNSKGNGSIMRSGWLGVLPYNDEIIIMMSILQSETTHEHPMASACSAIQSLLTAELLHSVKPIDSIIQLTLEKILIIKDIIQETPFEYITTSLDTIYNDCDSILEGWEYYNPQKIYDPNIIYGKGWVAEEALYNSLACIDSFPHKPLKAIERMIHVQGDSDTIGAIGGCLLGAMYGYEKLEYPIEENIEKIYKEVLHKTVKILQDFNFKPDKTYIVP